MIAEGLMERRGDGANEPASLAERIRAKRRVTVPLSIGESAEVRGLSVGEIAANTGVLVDLMALAKETKDGEPVDPVELAAGPKAAKVLAGMECVIRAGTVNPLIGTDPAAGLVVGDLSAADQVALFTAIMELSGRTKEEADRIRP